MGDIQDWEKAAKLYMHVAPKLDARLEARHRLGLSDVFALRTLAEDPLGHMRIQALAEAIGLSASATSRLVTRLEASGLLQRFLCDTDRRGMYTALTDDGRAELRKAEETYAAAVQEILRSEREVA